MNSAIFVLASLIGGVSGFLLGVSLMEVTPATTWLYDYQTLVAGLLAIVAAALTVVAMIWIDIRQQRRHAELVRLSLRTDALRLRRISTQPVETLRDIHRMVTEIVADIESRLVEPSALITTLDRSVSDLREAVSRMNEATDLFDVDTTNELKALNDGLRQIRSSTDAARGIVRRMEKDPLGSFPFDEHDRKLRRYASELHKISGHGNALAARVEGLMRQLSALEFA